MKNRILIVIAAVLIATAAAYAGDAIGDWDTARAKAKAEADWNWGDDPAIVQPVPKVINRHQAYTGEGGRKVTNGGTGTTLVHETKDAILLDLDDSNVVLTDLLPGDSVLIDSYGPTIRVTITFGPTPTPLPPVKPEVR